MERALSPRRVGGRRCSNPSTARCCSRCPECGGPLAAKVPRAPEEEPEFDERLSPTLVEDQARARSEGPDYAHHAQDLVCAACGAVVPWVVKEPSA